MPIHQPIHTKTIFISSFHGLILRVLESGILDKLLEDKTISIVLLVPRFKEDYFKKTFRDTKRIVIESADASALPARSHFFHRLSFMLLDTNTMRLMRRTYRGYRGKPFTRFGVQAFAEMVGHFRWGRALFRWLNYHFSGQPVFDALFEKYKPALVFSTDSKHLLDTALLIEAKKRGTRTVSMVRSWDYLTAKGTVRVKPDTLLVHNEIIKKEACMLADMNPENVIVVGIPHFDPYVNEKRASREVFCARVGADQHKRLILLAPVGDKFGTTDAQLLELLDEAIENGTLPSNLQVLVRVPPGDDMSLSATVPCEKHIRIDYPGVTFKGMGRKVNEMTYGDLLHLADSLYHSELVLSSPSTMVIDAAAFGKPVVGIGFEGKSHKDYLDSFVHIFDYDHMQYVIKTGGMTMAHSPAELFGAIRQYFRNPKLKEHERARIVREQCGAFDGHASERTASVILSLL